MKKIGLVLGGGAVRGLAHLGVLKSFEKHGIPIHCIIGTSMGGVIGGVFAAGIAVHEIEHTFIHTPKYRFLDLGLWQRGLLAGNGINQMVGALLEQQHKAGLNIEQFPISFKAIAVDLMEGKQVTLDKGDPRIALRATSAFPGVFAPVYMDGQMLVDGGVLNNLPVSDMRKEDVDFVIAVDVAREHEKKPPRNMIEVVYRSYSLMTAERKHSSLHMADLVIRPEVGQYAAFDFTKTIECIAAGEEATESLIPKLMQILKE
ncbi:patatin-like phospholipase family protein [Paenibacillus sp. FSL W8-0194]|uniref:patatin-like phospholipase family protein n=1 Tax=Paenibacillus sp. FSL W8-0194 TaxID=2921711 RepID=UPI0030DBCD62